MNPTTQENSSIRNCPAISKELMTCGLFHQIVSVRFLVSLCCQPVAFYLRLPQELNFDVVKSRDTCIGVRLMHVSIFDERNSTRAATIGSYPSSKTLNRAPKPRFHVQAAVQLRTVLGDNLPQLPSGLVVNPPYGCRTS